jgi:glycosyltransferase involved in cell wall biosynthesis
LTASPQIERASTRVAILLSTYNGERFLEQQLDSLLAQSHDNFIIVLRDDCSTDSTPSILQRYSDAHPQLFHKIKDDGCNRGPSGSFSLLCEYLLSESSALGFNGDNIVACFCDQDDVWAPNKIELSVAALLAAEAGDKSKPVLVHTDLRVVDASLQPIAPSFVSYQGLEIERHAFAHLAVSNLVTGCTACFNGALLRVALPVPKRAIMHDWWLAMVAAGFGKLVFLEETPIAYRQHGSNAVGAKPKKIEQEAAGFIARLFALERNAHLVDVAKQAREFSRSFGSQLSFAQRRALFFCARMNTQNAIAQRVFYRLARAS